MPAFRVSSARSASGGSSSEANGCIPGLSGGGPENRPGPNRRSGFVDGQQTTCQSRSRATSHIERRCNRLLDQVPWLCGSGSGRNTGSPDSIRTIVQEGIPLIAPTIAPNFLPSSWTKSIS